MRAVLVCLLVCGVVAALAASSGGENSVATEEELASNVSPSFVQSSTAWISMKKFRKRVLHTPRKKKSKKGKRLKGKKWQLPIKTLVKKTTRRSLKSAYGYPVKRRPLPPKKIVKEQCPAYWRRIGKLLKKDVQFNKLAKNGGRVFFNWWGTNFRTPQSAIHHRRMRKKKARKLRHFLKKKRHKLFKLREAKHTISRRVRRDKRLLGVAFMQESEKASRRQSLCSRKAPKVGKVTRKVVKKFAPVFIFDKKEKFFPAPVQHYFKHMQIGRSYFRPRRAPRGCRSGNLLSCVRKMGWTTGFSYNKKGKVPPLYSIVRRQGSRRLSITYWVFFPFSAGKKPRLSKRKLGLAAKRGRLLVSSIFGDWKSVTVNLRKRLTFEVMSYKIGNVKCTRSGCRKRVGRHWKRVRGRLRTVKGSKHPLIYVARNSHNFRPSIGRGRRSTRSRKIRFRLHFKKRTSCPLRHKVVDFISDGRFWKSWANIKITKWRGKKPYVGHFCFLNARQRWGPPRSGCVRALRPGQVCVFDDSPRGPIVQMQKKK